MIRRFEAADMDAVIQIWLDASIQAHDFIEPQYWRSKTGDMRDVYLPNADTYVYEAGGVVTAFLCLHENSLAALFVDPAAQGRGAGRALMGHAKALRDQLRLTVYKDNQRAVDFYRKHGFEAVSEQTDQHTGHTELVMEFPA